MTKVEKLTLEKDFLFKWLVDLLDRKESHKGVDSMEKLVQDALDHYIRIKGELRESH